MPTYFKMRETLIANLTWLFVLLPIIIALSKISVIDKSYYWFIIFLSIDFISESISPFITNIKYINIFQLIVSNIGILVTLKILFRWGYLKNKLKVKNIIVVGFVALSILDLIIEPHNSIRVSWFYLISMPLMIIVLVHFLTTLNKEPITNKKRLSILLIILPIIILSIYYSVLQILMAFLYNSNTQSLFIKLFDLIIYINLANYICYSLAFLWAPKNEVYLDMSQEQHIPQLQK
jgi:hypothetical protein